VTPATKSLYGPDGGYDAAALRSRRRTNLRLIAPAALAAALVALLALAPGAMADVFTPESGGSPNADKIDDLYKIVLYISIPIFLLVEGVLIWCLVKYRARRGGPEPTQIRGNHQLELGWTIGAGVIVVVIAVVTFLFLDDIKNPPGSNAGGLAQGVQVASIDQQSPPKTDGREFLTIGVNGQQYLWRFDYPGDAISYYKMVVPTNTTVVLKITSSDVQHSWWIPKLGGKADAVPGHTNETWFKISKEGTYKGQCAELCGSNHADMRGVVQAVSPQRYQAFIARQKRNLNAAEKGLAASRKKREAQTQGAEGDVN
jgi:cytochrome c oxidase subunit 2